MRPRRLKTFDYIGCYHYSLTFCTYRRNRYFEDPALVDRVARQFSRTSAEHQIEELAYCYMPDHVHLLLAGLHDGASLLPCVEVMRQRSGRFAKASQAFVCGRTASSSGSFAMMSSSRRSHATSSRILLAHGWQTSQTDGPIAVGGCGSLSMEVARAEARAYVLQCRS
jgi:REP element-mobilizing transposase RayT